MKNKKVDIIIPAFNEEERIGSVLDVVTHFDEAGRIIVIDDGSTDKTEEIALKYDVELIKFQENKGKGAALQAGIGISEADIVLFLDADLIGLREDHLHTLINPLLKDEDVEMTLGIFKGGRFRTDFAMKVAPYLSGLRAVNKSFLEKIPSLHEIRYGTEVALNRYAKQNNMKMKKVELSGLTHIMKEEKIGFVRGLAFRFKMYLDIVKFYLTPKKSESHDIK